MMEGILVASLFWDNVFRNEFTEFQQKNQAYFPIPISQEEKNRAFYQGLAKDTTSIRNDMVIAKVSKEAPKEVKKKITTVVIAPHPDDETLCCSERIEDKLARGEEVKIIYITNGDALDKTTADKARAYGDWRKIEAKNVARDMGLIEDDLFFLGFPDGELMNLNRYGSVTSRFTERMTSSRDSYFPQSAYTREQLKRNIVSLLNRFEPDEIYLPSETDKHPDHKFSGMILHEIINENPLSPDVYEYVVHGKKVAMSGKVDVNENKLQLIRKFRSQFWTDFHRNFMEQFASIPETFTRIQEKVVQNNE